MEITKAILLAEDEALAPGRPPFPTREVLFKPIVRWVLDTVRGAGVAELALCFDGNRAGWLACSSLPDTLPLCDRQNELELLAQLGFFTQPVLLVAADALFLDRTVLTALLASEKRRMVCDGERPVAAVLGGAEARALCAQGGLAASDAPRVDLRALCPGTAYHGFAAYSARELLRLSELARRRELDRLLDFGVVFTATDGVLVSPDAVVGVDTVILPGTELRGRCHIGRNCRLGPNTVITDSVVGDGCVINQSQVTRSVVHEQVTIGPFSQLRPHSELCDRVKVGDFVEIKNSYIGARTSVAHLTYIGDSDVGADVNFGCGTVTSNYDGVDKHRTIIGNGAFIGCNTNLIAPVVIGDGAYTAAGSTITADVPPDALAIARVRQEIKPGWASKKLAFKRKK